MGYLGHVLRGLLETAIAYALPKTGSVKHSFIDVYYGFTFHTVARHAHHLALLL